MAGQRKYWVAALLCAAAGCGKTASSDKVGPGDAPGAGSGGSAGAMSSTVGAGSGRKGEDAACRSSLPEDETRPGYEPDDAVLSSVESTLQSMPLASKFLQLSGLPNPSWRGPAAYRDIHRSPDASAGDGNTVRGWRFRDGGRGVNLVDGQDNRPSDGKDYSTAFPAQSIRAASWNVDLEYRIGAAHGDETMASLNTVLRAPTLSLLRHPYWGQSQASYGEDTFHVGRMASAFVAGAQRHVLACAVGFAANDVENDKSNLNAVLEEQALREIYGRQFEMLVREGGVGCVVAAPNLVNGQKTTQNRHLLTELLRTDFGFRGVVISGQWAMPGDSTAPDAAQAEAMAVEALLAGLDVELPWTLHFDQLPAALNNGRLSLADVDRSVARVLEQKFRFGNQYADGPYGLGRTATELEASKASVTNNQAHLDLAEEAALESAVLLTNGPSDAPVLPLGRPSRIAVIGPTRPVQVVASTHPPVTGTSLDFATQVNLGDRGPTKVNADPALSVGPFEGIRAIAERHGVGEVVTGNSVEAAAGADFVVVVVGLHAGDEGDERSLASRGDRKTLELPDDQAAFVSSLLDLGKPTAIFVESGSTVNLPWLSHPNRQQATIWAGYSGQRAGLAFGKLLFGDANFSGKLPFTWVREADLPAFQGDAASTSLSYFLGYRLYDALDTAGAPVEPVFPFGHGLSYTTFEYSNLVLPCTKLDEASVVDVSVDIENVGSVPGADVVMLFVQGPPKPADVRGERSLKELKGFAKVVLAAGETQRVTIPLRARDLRHWEGDANGSYVLDPGEYTVLAGPNATELPLKSSFRLDNSKRGGAKPNNISIEHDNSSVTRTESDFVRPHGPTPHDSGVPAQVSLLRFWP